MIARFSVSHWVLLLGCLEVLQKVARQGSRVRRCCFRSDDRAKHSTLASAGTFSRRIDETTIKHSNCHATRTCIYITRLLSQHENVYRSRTQNEAQGVQTQGIQAKGIQVKGSQVQGSKGRQVESSQALAQGLIKAMRGVLRVRDKHNSIPKRRLPS